MFELLGRILGDFGTVFGGFCVYFAAFFAADCLRRSSAPSYASAASFRTLSDPHFTLIHVHSCWISTPTAIYPSIYSHLVHSAVSGSPVNPSVTPPAPIQRIQASADSVLRPLSLPFDLGRFLHFSAAFAVSGRR